MSWPAGTRIAAALWGGLLLVACPLGAQVSGDTGEPEARPRVERISFPGAGSLDSRELREAIVTRATRCRSLLLRPVCWVAEWGPFIEEHFLDPEELPADELRLRVLYFRRGFREAQVTSEVRPRDDGVEVLFHVDEGEPTLVERFELRQVKRVLNRRQLRRVVFPREGGRLDLVRLDSATARLEQLLGEEGYLDGVVRDSIAVEPGTRLADVSVTVDPGPRSTLELLAIEGNLEVSDRVIRDATILREGQVLRTSDLVAARRSLYESNLFHEALLALPPGQDSAKVVEIAVREAPPRAPSVGGGFNTVDYVQVEAGFTHYNWTGNGRRLILAATVGNLLARQLAGKGIFRDIDVSDPFFDDRDAFLRPTWQVSAEVLQPSFRAAENRVGAAVFTHRRVVTGVAVDRGYGASASFTRLLRGRSTLSFSYRYEVARVEAGEVYFCVNFGICDPPSIDALRERNRLSPLALSYNEDRTDDPLSPTYGHRLRLEAELASTYTGSDFRYGRAIGTASYYLPFEAGRRVLAMQARAGWIRPFQSTMSALGLGDDDETAIIHPRKRFFAGGSQSVRGYGENQLGPRILTVNPDALTDPRLADPCTPEEVADLTCDPNNVGSDAFLPRPLGGDAVLQGNIEYRFPVWRELGGAIFVDGAYVRGRTATLGASGVAAITPGFGVRYASSFGLIRADIGIRPNVVERLPVVTEVVDETGERQLVRLNTERRWDPLDGTGSFLDHLLRRMQLHLSIGQAF